MRNHTAFLVLLALAVTGPLSAQDRPTRGKIDGVERDSKKGDGGGGGGECDCGSGWLEALGDGVFGGIENIFFPRHPGRGYQPYPYAEDDSLPAFAVHRTDRGRRYGNVSAAYFADAGSTLKGGRFALEGGASVTYLNFEFNSYVEPLASETDHLQSWRLGIGVLPRMGSSIFRMGFAIRGLILDDGSSATGPELELGVQVFPRRPFGVQVNGRIADVGWEDGGSSTFHELNTVGSVFVGRFEFQAGWHWVRVGDNPAIGGPTIGTRLWF